LKYFGNGGYARFSTTGATVARDACGPPTDAHPCGAPPLPHDGRPW
jgi:hypothetical protein